MNTFTSLKIAGSIMIGHKCKVISAICLNEQQKRPTYSVSTTFDNDFFGFPYLIGDVAVSDVSASEGK